MGTEAETTVETEATEEEVVTTEEPKGSTETKQTQEEYDKTQQQLDQERANNRKLRQTLDTATSERDALSGQLSGVQNKVAELEAQLQSKLTAKEYDDLANLDPETTDFPEMVNAHKKAVEKVRTLETELNETRKYIAERRARELQEAEAARTAELIEGIYQECDEEYGAKYRNEAISLANKLVNDGDEPQPQAPFPAMKLMRRCYREVKDKAERAKPKDKKATVPTDTGLRGLAVNTIEDSEEFKPGSISDVKADMRKRMKAGTWNPTAFGSPG